MSVPLARPMPVTDRTATVPISMEDTRAPARVASLATASCALMTMNVPQPIAEGVPRDAPTPLGVTLVSVILVMYSTATAEPVMVGFILFFFFVEFRWLSLCFIENCRTERYYRL